jgi:hypothetical protein
MKGKITIVLLSLALVFGMIAASCDDGAYPAFDEKDATIEFAYKATGNTDGVPDDPLTVIKGQDLFDMLAEYSSLPTVTDPNNRVKTYLLTKVAAPAGGDTTAIAQKKTLHAGMPLIIKNPSLP